MNREEALRNRDRIVAYAKQLEVEIKWAAVNAYDSPYVEFDDYQVLYTQYYEHHEHHDRMYLLQWEFGKLLNKGVVTQEDIYKLLRQLAKRAAGGAQ